MERKEKGGLILEKMLQHLHEEDKENNDHEDVLLFLLTDEDKARDDLSGEVAVQDVPESPELHNETNSCTAEDSTSKNYVGANNPPHPGKGSYVNQSQSGDVSSHNTAKKPQG